jgi:hypothetical protein
VVDHAQALPLAGIDNFSYQGNPVAKKVTPFFGAEKQLFRWPKAEFHGWKDSWRLGRELHTRLLELQNSMTNALLGDAAAVRPVGYVY